MMDCFSIQIPGNNAQTQLHVQIPETVLKSPGLMCDSITWRTCRGLSMSVMIRENGSDWILRMILIWLQVGLVPVPGEKPLPMVLGQIWFVLYSTVGRD